MRTLMLFFLLSSSCTVFAQVKQASPEFLKATSTATCECFATKMAADASADPTTMLGLCMIGYLNDNLEETRKNFGDFNLADNKMMEKIGEQIGMRMAVDCPETIMRIAGEGTGTNDEAPALLEVSGTLKSVAFGSPVVVTITEEGGRPVKCYWLEYFAGSEALYGDAAIGKKITVSYENKDLFSGAERDYFTRRVIRGVTVE